MKNEIYLMASILLFISVFSVGVSAYADAEINTKPVSLSTCPCDTLTAKHINAYLENKGSSGSFELSLDLPDGWSGFIKPEIYVANGEEKKIDPLWITAGCGCKPGVKTIEIKATSEEGKTFTETFDVNVLKCHYLEIDAPQEVEVCDGKTRKVNLEIKNEGRFEERVKLSSNREWAELAEDTITIAKKSSETIPLVLDPEESGEVKISAVSTNSYAEASLNMDVSVSTCYDFDAYLRPERESICLKESSDRKLIIENKGSREDEYTILSPEWLDIGIDTVHLKPGKKGEVSFSITPDELGRKDFYFKISSDKADKEVRLDGMVETNECRDVVVITTPSEKKICQGEKTQFEVMVKNSGNVEEVYHLETSLGTLGRDKVVLESGEAKKLTLTVDTKNLSPQTREIVVRAYKEGISDTSRISLEINNCYSADLRVEPQVQEACQCDDASFIVTVENTGKYEDTYTLKYGGSEKEFTLEPGEKDEFLYDFTAMYKSGTVNDIEVKLYSSNVMEKKNATIKMKPSSECYSVDIETGEDFECCDLEAPRCKASVVPLKLKNNGGRTDTYSISVIGPEWTYLEKNKTSLGINESEVIYLYVSPPFEANLEEYSVDVIAESRKTEDKLVLNIEVIPNGTATMEEEAKSSTTTIKIEEPLEEDNETEEINVSENETEDDKMGVNETPTGEAVKDEETGLWQRVTFFVILIVVIAILGYIIFS
ncbi:MAG: hypothetical protein ABEK36_01030 [Candidatus Aenigmatarchaeota archaeon]